MKTGAEYLVLVGLLVFLLLRGILPAWNEVHSDFANYYVSAKLVTEGSADAKLYDNEWFQAQIERHGIETHGKFSPFPPITSWMMIPLTPFDPLTAQRLFLLLNLAFLSLGLWLVHQIAGWNFRHAAIFLLASGHGIANNLAFGQVYAIMAIVILLAVYLEVRKPAISGLLLAVFTALKYFPITLAGGYILNEAGRRFSSKNSGLIVVGWFLLTLVILIATQYGFFGIGVMNEFFTTVFIPHLDGKLAGQGLYSFQFQSWDNFFRHLFIYEVSFNPHPFIDWPQGKTICKSAVTLLVCGLTAYTMVRRRNGRPEERKLIFLALPALAALVLLPASATYHYVLLIVPLVLLLSADLPDFGIAKIALPCYALIGFIPYAFAFRLAESWGLLFAYPRLWLVLLLYLIVIARLLRWRPL